MQYEAIVIGVSSGGMSALKILSSSLPLHFNIPIIVVQHLSAQSDSHWIKLLSEKSQLNLKEVDEKDAIEKGNIYIAPPNYHLLIEKDKTFSLTIDARVNFARPSIDVLFESAAEAYTNKLIGIVLTGSNSDGTKGIKRIKDCGGLAIIQDPKTAEYEYMPTSAIAAIVPDYILPLEDIIKLLIQLDQQKK